MKKYSKDPKVRQISIEEFLDEYDFLRGITKKNFWKGKKPEIYGEYFKITNDLAICVSYNCSFTNFGTSVQAILEEIVVAQRDGVTEYALYDNELDRLLEEKSKHKRSKKIDSQIELTKKAKKLFPKRKGATIPVNQTFESHFIDTGYKTSLEAFKNKYIVFDVETNGTRKSNDDLLSLSIYDPTTGICYNRFFPLDLQPLVLTTYINGITDEMLNELLHWNQDEVDSLIEYFDLKNKTLLSYSGGKGLFDSSFLINYCKRHKLSGFEDLKYENIKSLIPETVCASEGQLSKDNLCKILGIDGVFEQHTSYNDCLLEWKLFEQLKNEKIVFADNKIYKYHDGYIVPISLLNRCPELAKYASIKIPYIIGRATLEYEYLLPNKITKSIKKYPTNITGIALENGLNAYLNVEKQSNKQFLIKNKKLFELIGTLDNNVEAIPISLGKDGSLKSLSEENDDYINDVNETTRLLMNNLSPVFDYIKNNIFHNSKIISQELVISADGKVLALCDLSSKEKVLEIKTYGLYINKGNEIVNQNLLKQLYYESNNRPVYLLSIDIQTHRNQDFKIITDAVIIHIYHIELEISEPKPQVFEKQLWLDEIDVLKAIIKNSCATAAEIAAKKHMSVKNVYKCFKTLKTFGYIKREDETKSKSPWKILRNAKDNKTKYYFENDVMVVLPNESK